MPDTCSKCKKKVSMWKSFYVGDKVLCENCHKKEEEKIKKREALKSEIVYGLGGWLIFVQIALIFGIIMGAQMLIDMTDVVIYWYLILVWCVLQVIVLTFMYAKNKKFPYLAIIWVWYSFLFVSVSFAGYTFFGAGETESFSIFPLFLWILLLIIAIIGTIYFKNSKRVKNTFTK
ncbi:MAG: DUF2569 domain-containing protein [Nanoarchaeota archaeon]|nr:DUF2569 domain-containing protein [Nanoarchaeota archaeon]